VGLFSTTYKLGWRRAKEGGLGNVGKTRKSPGSLQQIITIGGEIENQRGTHFTLPDAEDCRQGKKEKMGARTRRPESRGGWVGSRDQLEQRLVETKIREEISGSKGRSKCSIMSITKKRRLERKDT